MAPTSTPHNAFLTAWESYKSSLASRRTEHLAQFETITTGGGICQYGTLTLTEKDFPAEYKHIQDRREDDNRINKAKNKETNSLPELTRLRYTAEVVHPVAPNKEPVGGYPLYIGLHGGGGYPTRDIKTLAEATSSNDTQWNYMSRAYKGALTLGGVWVALRGIGDTWDLHFTAAGYILLDRLIENMILFGAKQSPTSNDGGPAVSINPNRVYLIGFSAGGDGVYRLANRLAQRFAAVNMGGGHAGSMIQHAGIPDSDKKRLDNGLLNLANTPTCLQVGMGDRYDDAAVRSWTVAQSGVDLDANQAHYRNNVVNNPGADIYDHAVYIHTDHISNGDWHFSWESSNFQWHGKKSRNLDESQVIADYKAWKDSWKNGQLPADTPGTVGKPTNAILHWFTESHTRSPAPQYIVWDLTTPRGNDNINEDIFRCLGAKGSQNYWLDIGDGTRLMAGVTVPIVAGMDDKTNTITIYSTGNMSYLRILLRPHMKVSIEKDITVQIHSEDNTTQPQIITPIQIGWSTSVINDTVARNDPSLVFCSDIVLTKDSNGAKTWYWNTNSPKTPAKKSRL